MHDIGLFVLPPCDLDEAALAALAERLSPVVHGWLIDHADDWEYLFDPLDEDSVSGMSLCRLWVALYDAADATVFLLTFGTSRRSSF